MQHATIMQVAHAASDVMRNVEHCLDAGESSAEAALRRDTPGQDCVLQPQGGTQSVPGAERRIAARGGGFMQAKDAAGGEDMLRRACMLQSRGGSQKDPGEKHRVALRWPNACQMHSMLQ